MPATWSPTRLTGTAISIQVSALSNLRKQTPFAEHVIYSSQRGYGFHVRPDDVHSGLSPIGAPTRSPDRHAAVHRACACAAFVDVHGRPVVRFACMPKRHNVTVERSDELALDRRTCPASDQPVISAGHNTNLRPVSAAGWSRPFDARSFHEAA